jgi:ABC-type phosphate/phosphonate transport system ATPase subunit
MDMIQVRNISKVFRNGCQASQGISLTVEQGEEI